MLTFHTSTFLAQQRATLCAFACAQSRLACAGLEASLGFGVGFRFAIAMRQWARYAR